MEKYKVMKKLLLILLCLPIIGFGQDRIILMDSTEILSRVLEVNEKNIRYRKYTNLEGPIYSKLKTEIDKIIYTNGEEDSFSKARAQLANAELLKELKDWEDRQEGKAQLDKNEEEYFMVVENMPKFPGGDLGLMKYINKNVKYPPIAKKYNITGKVYISFVVDRSGSVTNVKVVRGVDKNLDAEAVRVIKSLPKYKPGKQRGKPVRVMFTVPINFTLN